METALTESLLAGGKLMLIGMGIVFLFLSLLVGIIGATAKLLRRYSPESENLAGLPGIGAASEPGEADVVAAIAAAIHRYRQR